MYSSIGINKQKELNYLGKRTKIPKIADKTNCCCDHDHFNFFINDSESSQANDHKFNFKEDMQNTLCPIRDFMMEHKKIIGIAAGALFITLSGIKLIKEFS